MKYLIFLMLFGCKGETLYMDDGPSSVSSPVTEGPGATPYAINITSPAPITTAEVGEEFYHQVSAYSSRNLLLTYALQNAPAGMNIHSKTGVITWTPISGQTSSGAVLITVTDQNGNREEQVLHLTVSQTGSPGGSSPGDGPVTPPLDPPDDIEEGDDLIEEDPVGATDWSATDDAGVVTYFNSMEEAQTHAKDENKPRSIVSYKGKSIFARRSLIIPFNTQPKNPGDLVESVPVYSLENLDLAYSDYYKRITSNGYTTIGPGGRGWHITYLFPLDIKKVTKPNNWWANTDWPSKNPGVPLEEQLFVNVGLDGKRDLYIHVDFIKELILLKDAADLHHFIRKSKTYTVKGGTDITYEEMSHIQLWGEDMPDGSETHPENATPAPFIKKPNQATYSSTTGNPYDLAPSWMEFGKKYYTFDYHYFYENFEDMGRDIAQDSNSRSVNKESPYINIYNFFNIFKAGSYTVEEIFEYMDHRIDESQQYKNACEVSLLSDVLPSDWKTANQGDWPSCNYLIPPFSSQKSTFENMAFKAGGAETGINPAIMIAISEGESGFGRSSESHQDGDPFNFGNPYQTTGGTECDFCCDPNRCGKDPTLGVICSECCTACVGDLTNQFNRTAYIIRTWPLFWKDQILKGKKEAPIFGFKGGGVAQGYNPSLYWGVHMAAKYYKMDMWLGFCEKKKIYNMADPISDEILIFLNPTIKNDPNINNHIKNNANVPTNPCTKF
jgi:hypothetical protein